MQLCNLTQEKVGMNNHRLKLAVLGTWVPPKSDMHQNQAKEYQSIEVESVSVLPKARQKRSDPHQHESLVLHALTRGLIGVDVICIECLDHTGRGSFEWTMKALDLCYRKYKPDLIQMSMGFSVLNDMEAVQMEAQCLSLTNSHTVISAAAGNEGIDPLTGGVNSNSVCYPAKFDNVMAIGSSEEGVRNKFSSVGGELFITMDGHNEQCVGINGSKVTWSGTSLASPKFGCVCARMIQELDKLPVKPLNRTNWLQTTLPFLAEHEYSTGSHEWLEWDNRVGYGSLEKVYSRFAGDYDKYKKQVKGNLKIGL